MTPSDGRDAELLLLISDIENQLAAERISGSWELLRRALPTLRSAALPSPVDNPSREELAVACLRRLARANIDNITQQALAGSDIVSTLVKIDGLTDPDSMNDKRALEGMTLAHNVREATIRECAEIAKAVDDVIRGGCQSADQEWLWTNGGREMQCDIVKAICALSPPSPGERT